jgi:hypothetical protein
METALELDTIFCSANHPSHAPRQHPVSSHIPPTTTFSTTNPAVSAPATLIPHTNQSSNTGPSNIKQCSNCGHRGHTVPTCFSPG